MTIVTGVWGPDGYRTGDSADPPPRYVDLKQSAVPYDPDEQREMLRAAMAPSQLGKEAGGPVERLAAVLRVFSEMHDHERFAALAYITSYYGGKP